MIRNPGEFSRQYALLQESRNRLAARLPKSDKEDLLRVIRNLERNLGVEGEDYNKYGK